MTNSCGILPLLLPDHHRVLVANLAGMIVSFLSRDVTCPSYFTDSLGQHTRHAFSPSHG